MAVSLPLPHVESTDPDVLALRSWAYNMTQQMEYYINQLESQVSTLAEKVEELEETIDG